MSGPALDGGFGGLFAGVALVELAAGLVVRHRVLRVAVTERGPRLLLVMVEGAVDLFELGRGRDVDEAFEHAAGADRRQLRGVADRDGFRAAVRG